MSLKRPEYRTSIYGTLPLNVRTENQKRRSEEELAALIAHYVVFEADTVSFRL